MTFPWTVTDHGRRRRLTCRLLGHKPALYERAAFWKHSHCERCWKPIPWTEAATEAELNRLRATQRSEIV